MTKKGIIEEIFSKARFVDDARTYTITYRDFERIREITLSQFIKESNNFQIIPITRIEKIKKNHTILFEKNHRVVSRFGNS